MGRQRSRSVTCNSVKTKYHNEIVKATKNGELIGLIDCDTIVLKSLESIQKQDFDIAITYRPPKSRLIFNSGVVFVRVGKKIKKFYDEWEFICTEMLEDKPFFDDWKEHFGGINQTSLGYLLENGWSKKLDILCLTCQEWNCETETWKDFGSNTRIVHIMDILRDRCLGRPISNVPPYVNDLAKLWNQIEDSK
jgi:hypothetical protein